MCQYKSICNPIIELTTLLQSCGFTIEKQELKDWHFNEFEIVMKGKKLQLPMIDIEGIEQHSDYSTLISTHCLSGVNCVEVGCS